jgi:hypothetical protein
MVVIAQGSQEDHIPLERTIRVSVTAKVEWS